MDTPLSGYLGRVAHFGLNTPVQGVSDAHLTQTETGDIFNPTPETPAQQEGDVWLPRDVSVMGPIPFDPFSHWADLEDPVPLNVHLFESNTAATDRMVANHSVDDPHLDNRLIPYKVDGQGRSIEFYDGRAPWQGGETVADDMAFLVMGRNAFDQTQQPNEVYSGDSPNVGRYRLGQRIDMFGMLEFWTKQGQDADLRAYTGLVPYSPVDKDRVPNSAPYTPNSSGTTTWVMPQFRDPSLFSLPSETASTDYTVQVSSDQTTGDFQDDGGRM